MFEPWEWLIKLVAGYGGVGLCCWMLWRLIDKWAGQFLKAVVEQARATTEQAAATTSLAATVKEGQENGREVLMAVRLLAANIERQQEYLKRIDDRVAAQELRRVR